jgi:hypothetical protein
VVPAAAARKVTGRLSSAQTTPSPKGAGWVSPKGLALADAGGTDAVADRGLAIVRALTSLFWVSDGTEIRILLATIPAPAGGER